MARTKIRHFLGPIKRNSRSVAEGSKRVSPAPRLPFFLGAACFHLIAGLLMGWAGCASAPGPRSMFPDVRVVRLATPTEESGEAFEQVKDQWTARFSVSDPLFGSSAAPTPFLAGSKGRIKIEATLYGPDMIEAELVRICSEDSLSETQCAEKRAEYAQKHHTQEWFRIGLRLHSGYEERSLDPELWTIYLVDDESIMYEPASVFSDSLEKVTRQIYSEFYNSTMERNLFSRNVALYFPKTTFFGKALLNERSHSLKLILSRKKQTVGEAEWLFYRE
ncbi:MAG: hypothetical protein V1800_07740 [Candidatus Latescibacterota bacterium]